MLYLRITIALAIAGGVVRLTGAQTIIESFDASDALNPGLTTGLVDTRNGVATLGRARGAFVPPLTPFDAPKFTVSVGRRAEAFAAGDVTGDGVDDLVIATEFEDFFLDGSDLAGDPVQLSRGFFDRQVIRLVDINGDGLTDIFSGRGSSCCTSEPSLFLINTGSDDFPNGSEPRIEFNPPSSEYFPWIEFADLNMDGHIDAVFLQQDNTHGYILGTGDAAEFAQQPITPLPGPVTGTSGVIADFNNDGRPDLLRSGSFSGAAALNLNTGNPSAPFALAQLLTSSNVRAAAALDINSDGLVDGVGSDSSGDGPAYILNADGEGAFEPLFNLDNFSYEYEATFDVNLDGRLDVVGRDDDYGVWLNQGEGTLFAQDQSFVLRNSNTGIGEYLDINGDGVLDALIPTNNTVEIYVGVDGSNPFDVSATPSEFGAVQAPTSALAVADFDNDGDLDIAEATSAQNFVHINAGARTFVQFPLTADADSSRAIAAADLNGDGFPDLVVANNGQNRWYPNDLGDGPFRASSSGIPIGTRSDVSQDVALADVNGDGLLDVVFANNGVNTYVANGGTDNPFDATSVVLPIGTATDNTLSVAAGDFNGTGNVDVAFGNDGIDRWYASGAAGFDEASVGIALTNASDLSADMIVDDFDFDGRDDILVARPTGRCRWYRNTGTMPAFDPTIDGAAAGLNCSNVSLLGQSVAPADSTAEFLAAGVGQPVQLFALRQNDALSFAEGKPVSELISAARGLALARFGNGPDDAVVANFFGPNQIFSAREQSIFSAPLDNAFNSLAGRFQSRNLVTDATLVQTVAVAVDSDVPPNTTLHLWASNDGVTFLPLIPGRVLEFATPAPELFWRARLTTRSPVVTPVINELEFTLNPADVDQDNVPDSSDNCSLVFNPEQVDNDGDGFGNRCDADLNNDGIVNILDLGIMRAVFFSTSASAADLDNDGTVNTADLGLLRAMFFQPPGPGATQP